MINGIGRELPEHIDGYGPVISFAGTFTARSTTRRHAPPVKTVRPGESKLVGDIREALEKVGIRADMTLSVTDTLVEYPLAPVSIPKPCWTTPSKRRT